MHWIFYQLPVKISVFIKEDMADIQPVNGFVVGIKPKNKGAIDKNAKILRFFDNALIFVNPIL